MEYSFVMNQTGRILFSEKLGHFKDILSSERLIAAGPDQNSRMVLISLIHGVGAVQHHIQPFRSVTGNYSSSITCLFHSIPGTMGFQLRLIDKIQAVLIAETIQRSHIWTMTG